MIAIYGAIYTLAGIIAPFVMGAVIQHAAVPLDGYMTGFTINAVIMVASGLLGLLLLWPNTERARLVARPRRSRSLREGGVTTLSSSCERRTHSRAIIMATWQSLVHHIGGDGSRVRRDDTDAEPAVFANPPPRRTSALSPCAPRTSLPGRAPVALPPRCVTTPETMVAS